MPSITTTRLFKLFRTTYPSMGHLFVDLAKGLSAYAIQREIRDLPITVAMVEGAIAEDLHASNYDYERGQDTIQDMINTIGRRLPAGEDLIFTIDRGVEGNPEIFADRVRRHGTVEVALVVKLTVGTPVMCRGELAESFSLRGVVETVETVEVGDVFGVRLENGNFLRFLPANVVEAPSATATEPPPEPSTEPPPEPSTEPSTEPSQAWRIEIRFDFHGTKAESEVAAALAATTVGGEVTAIFDDTWEES